MFNTPQSYFRRQYFEVLDLLASELKRRFQQKQGLPVAAVLEKTLIDAANSSPDQVSDDLQIYKNDLNLVRLQTQLHMLPDLIRTRNMKPTCAVPIRRVTNVRTLCEVMNEVSMSKFMFSEVNLLHDTCYNCNCRKDILSTKKIENLLKSFHVTTKT